MVVSCCLVLLINSRTKWLSAQKSPKQMVAESTVSVAIAANPDAAIHAATHLKGITFVSPGEELTCLGEFPIDRSIIHWSMSRKKLPMRSWKRCGSGAFARLLSLPHFPSPVFPNVWGKRE